jgi:hypothetical protein
VSEYDDLRTEIAALRAQVSALSAPGAVPPPEDDTVSRRGLLGKVAAAAVGGAGLALLGARPADATTGTMQYGASNDAGTSYTSLTANTTGGTLRTLDLTQSGTGNCLGVNITNTGSTASTINAVTNGDGVVVDAGILKAGSTATCISGIARPEGIGIEGRGGTGVHGLDTNGGGSGVLGESTAGVGVYGYTDTGRGVYGYANSGAGSALYGYSNGSYGASLYGALAPLFLNPAGSAGHPTSGSHVKGEVYVDSLGALWQCITSGAPGKWVKPGFNPIGPSRLVSGATAAGAFTPAQKKDFLVQGFALMPAGVTAVAINLSARSTAEGYVTLYPTGTSRPTASQLTFAPVYQWSGFAVVRIGAGGKITCYNSAGSTKLSLDVAGFFA